MLVSSKEAIGFAKLSQLEIGGNLLHFAKHLQIANRAVVAHVTFGTFALIDTRYSCTFINVRENSVHKGVID